MRKFISDVLDRIFPSRVDDRLVANVYSALKKLEHQIEIDRAIDIANNNK